jgi:hypothetical protein
MDIRTRRQFLAQVGAGMLAAGIGPSLARDLGLSTLYADQEPGRLLFGALEPLVSLMQETPVAKLQGMLVNRWKDGQASAKDLIAAAALANARTFGGDDYVGFHSMFALMPAYALSKEMAPERQLLPILKAVYRNSSRIQDFGGGKKEALRPVQPAALPQGKTGGEALRDAIRRNDLKNAEETLLTLTQSSAAEAFNHVQVALHDSTEVHRVNIVYRAWSLLDLVGRENAHTLLRESLHYFAASESGKNREHFSGARALLPKLIDQYHLNDKTPGKQVPDDAWVEKTSVSLFKATPEQAAEMAAELLADGTSPDGLHEAIALAANQMVLRDDNKQAHGATNGVHCCDAVNAWRNIGRVSEPKNAFAAAIMAAYNFAFDRDNPKRNKFQEWEPYPRHDAREAVKTGEPAQLLRDLEDAIRAKDQARASAVVERYGESGAPAAPVFALYRRYVLSEHGSLHGEKYFRTVTEEFESGRAPFRFRQLVAMARYAASMYGEASPGYDEALRLLGL